MPPAGFEPAIPVGDRPQTRALDRSATGIGGLKILVQLINQTAYERLIYSSLNFTWKNDTVWRGSVQWIDGFWICK